MQFLPIMLNLKTKKTLVVGGGRVALRKINYLLNFQCNIEVIAQEFCEDVIDLLLKYDIKHTKSIYRAGDLSRFDIVIVATNDVELQKHIYMETKKCNCLCNCVDSKEFSDFIVPAYIKDGDLVVSISTNGTSPSFAKEFKNYIKTTIPKDVAIFLKEMEMFRKVLPKGEMRMKMCKEKVKNYIKSWSK